MALDLNQVQELLQSPKNKKSLSRAILLQNRLRFHTEADLSQYNARVANLSISSARQASTVFLNWVATLLPKDKYAIFLSLFKYPLPSTPVVKEVYRELHRVFNSRNASFSYKFTSTELEEDWLRYRQLVLKHPEFFNKNSWDAMRVSPCSFLVVDCPQLQTSSRPEPYYYWLGVENVIDYGFAKTEYPSQLSYLIFKQPNNRIAVFDEEYITIYIVDEAKTIKGIERQVAHNLGYCPATFFWTDSVNHEEKGVKANPITGVLSDLDWYLFFTIGKKHLDLYAPYPIYSSYEADCSFENNATGEYCDGGYLRNPDGEYIMLSDGTAKRCPICAEKRIAGPGSFIEIPVPNSAEGVPDMHNPVQITTIDDKSLNYNVSEVKRLHEEIITKVVGANVEVSSKEAINETQVSANFQTKTDVLNELKHNFEIAQKFVEDTVCRLRYGASFISSVINWGSEFYVFTVEQLYEKYDKAKKSGVTAAELDAIAQQIIEVEYRDNPHALQRMEILRQIEPYPHKTVTEVVELFKNGLLDKETVMLKINFPTYLSRFERENINVVEFGTTIPAKQKVEIISKKLMEYIAEDIKKLPQQVVQNV